MSRLISLIILLTTVQLYARVEDYEYLPFLDENFKIGLGMSYSKLEANSDVGNYYLLSAANPRVEASYSSPVYNLYRHRFFPIFGNGKNLMQPVLAQDLADAYFNVLSNREFTMNREYNLSGKDPISYIDLVRTVSRAVGVDEKIGVNRDHDRSRRAAPSRARP